MDIQGMSRICQGTAEAPRPIPNVFGIVTLEALFEAKPPQVFLRCEAAEHDVIPLIMEIKCPFLFKMCQKYSKVMTVLEPGTKKKP